MANIGIVTTEGLNKSMEAASNEGWTIKPNKFALSETKGLLDKTRSMVDLEPIWHTNWIGGRQVLSPESIMFFCSVSPEQTQDQMDINEIYLFAEDTGGEDFLLYIAQPENPVVYDPTGTTRFRLQVTIANLNIGAIYQFVYSQAQEIDAHNVDPLAHPDYQLRFETMGYPLNFDNHSYGGQLTDELPVFGPNVEHGDVIYYDITNTRYDRAIADSTEKERAIGLASIAPLYKAVRSGGYVQTEYHLAPHNFSNDTVIYLSDIDPGKITTNRTNVPLGVHMYAGLCYFPPSAGYLKWANIGGSGRNPVYADNDVNANPRDTIMADLTNNPFTVFLPNSPKDGDVVRVIDTKGLARVNNLSINGHGSAINKEFSNFIIDINYAMLSFVYDSGGNNWLVDLGGSRFAGYIE